MSVVVVGTLAEQEAIIEESLAGFVEIGNALMRIRDEELYREAGFDGFVAYLEFKPWGISRARAYQQIEAAQVSNIVGNVQNDRQALELAPLMRANPDNPEVVIDLFEEVKKETGGKPTAKKIKEKVASVLPKKRPTKPKNHSVHPEMIQHLESFNRLGKSWSRVLLGRLSQTQCRKEYAKIQEAQELLARMSEAYAPQLDSLSVIPKGVS